MRFLTPIAGTWSDRSASTTQNSDRIPSSWSRHLQILQSVSLSSADECIRRYFRNRLAVQNNMPMNKRKPYTGALPCSARSRSKTDLGTTKFYARQSSAASPLPKFQVALPYKSSLRSQLKMSQRLVDTADISKARQHLFVVSIKYAGINSLPDSINMNAANSQYSNISSRLCCCCRKRIIERSVSMTKL